MSSLLFAGCDDPGANSAPKATNVVIVDDNGGALEVGDALTGSYDYEDAEGDAEGGSTFRWLRDGMLIVGAIETGYTLQTIDVGAALVFEVTPIASSGYAVGVSVASSVLPMPAGGNAAPTASEVAIVDDNGGDAEVGDSLTGTYVYEDAEGDAEGVSTFRWLRNRVAIAGATARTYVLMPADSGAIVFEVTPVAITGGTTGGAAGAAIQSAELTVGGASTTPSASAVTIFDDNGGGPEVGDSLSGTYTYLDPAGEDEGASTYQWYRGNATIGDSASLQYTLVAADAGTDIYFEVTPVANDGTSGSPVKSAALRVELPTVSVDTVTALYANAANWGSYVENDGADDFSATDTACITSISPPYTADMCFHGGEYRQVTISGVSSCDDLQIRDDLDALEWRCLLDGGVVSAQSSRLKPGKYLSDLLAFPDDDTTQWREMALIIEFNGVEVARTAASTWWANPLVNLQSEADVGSPGDNIYIATSNTVLGGAIRLRENNSMVVKPGYQLVSADITEPVIKVGDDRTASSFIWIEGSFDGLTGQGIRVYKPTTRPIRRVVLRNVTIDMQAIEHPCPDSSCTVPSADIPVGLSVPSNMGVRFENLNISYTNTAALSTPMGHGMDVSAFAGVINDVVLTDVPGPARFFNMNTVSFENFTVNGGGGDLELNSPRNVAVDFDLRGSALKNLSMIGVRLPALELYAINSRVLDAVVTDSLPQICSGCSQPNTIFVQLDDNNRQTSPVVLENIAAISNPGPGMRVQTVGRGDYGTASSISGLVAANNQGDGLYLRNLRQAHDIRASNNRGNGIRSEGSSLVDVVSVNNDLDGILVSGELRYANTPGSNSTSLPAFGAALINAVSANNAGTGVVWNDTTSPSINQHDGHIAGMQSVATHNNGGAGLRIYNVGDGTVFENLSMTYNGGNGLHFGNSQYTDNDTRFLGQMIVTGNATNCVIETSANGIDASCAPIDSSDFALVDTIDASTAFVGRVSSDANAATGASAYGAIASWQGFDNRWRLWGKAGSSGIDVSARGACTTGDECGIWDYTPGASSPLRDSNVKPMDLATPFASANWTWEYIRTRYGQYNYLRATAEILGDGLGNEDGWCDASEECLLSPNIGAYQGRGTRSIYLQGTGADAWQNITVYRFTD